MAKAPSALLKKPKLTDKGYTKTQLVAHLTEAVNNQDLGEVSKKQVAAVLEELSELMIKYAPVGATLPTGIGKLVLKKTPARPARMGTTQLLAKKFKSPRSLLARSLHSV